MFFRINGVVHHRIGSLLPVPGHCPEYAQLYVYGTKNEGSNRLAAIPSERNFTPDPSLVASLIQMLDDHNPLVHQFRLARDRLISPTSPDVIIRLQGTIPDHGTHFSLPAASELAALLIDGLTTETHTLDIVVQTRAGDCKHIHPIHPSLMALQYPLLFPYGDVGYDIGMKLWIIDPANPPSREKLSMAEYYTYQMHYCVDEPSPILCSGRLSQQYVVDAYSCVEGDRLSYFVHNRSSLRMETYQGITGAVGHGAASGKEVGVKKILPASHIGSKRYMNQNFHDCMAICCAYGPPDKFTTMTCNPKWPEISEGVRWEPCQSLADRGDIVVRVFHMKLQEYLEDIKKRNIFGPVEPIGAPVHTISFILPLF
jgi:hypothetical protein